MKLTYDDHRHKSPQERRDALMRIDTELIRALAAGEKVTITVNSNIGYREMVKRRKHLPSYQRKRMVVKKDMENWVHWRTW